MKTCPRCSRSNTDRAMVCSCGHSFVDPRDMDRKRLTYGSAGGFGCIIGFLSFNVVCYFINGVAMVIGYLPGQEYIPKHLIHPLGWVLVTLGVLCSINILLLRSNYKISFYLSFVFLILGFFIFPIGTILSPFMLKKLWQNRFRLRR